MAEKKSTSSEKTNVRRIKATDDTPKKPAAKTVKKVAVTDKKKVASKTSAKTSPATSDTPKGPLKAIGGYFKGAWEELKLVRWPNRSSTWSMTAAVLLFTGIFTAFILLLDAGFSWAFEQILK